MRKSLALCVFLLLAQPAAAEVYKYVDAQGRTHYTDKPPDKNKAELLQLQVNTYSGKPVLEQNSEALAGLAKSRVLLYGTQRCGVCKVARNWLRKRGVSFSDYDIDRSVQAQKEYLQMGVSGVPVIVVGRQRMLGFNEATMLQMLDRKK